MHAILWPAHTWFLIIVCVQMYVCVCVCVYVCVCVPTSRLLITSNMMWCDMAQYDWLNKFYSCYMATVVSIINGRGLGIDTCRKTNP